MKPEPPRIALWITGAVITCLSSTMAKRWPTLSLVTSPNWRAPTLSKRKSTTGCAGLLVEALAGIGQAVAGHHHPPLHHDLLRRLVLVLVQHRQDFIADGRGAGVGIGLLVHQLEGHLGGLAQDFLELGGILQARHLHQDAVFAGQFDGGLLVPSASIRRRTTSMD